MYTCKIDKEKNLIIITLSGTFNFQKFMNELAPAVRKEIDDCDTERSMNRIFDMRNCHTNFNQKELEQFSEFTKDQNKIYSGIKVAIIASSDLLFGLLRMYSVYSYSKGVNRHIFRTMEEAMEWLSVG